MYNIILVSGVEHNDLVFDYCEIYCKMIIKVSLIFVSIPSHNFFSYDENVYDFLF